VAYAAAPPARLPQNFVLSPAHLYGGQCSLLNAAVGYALISLECELPNAESALFFVATRTFAHDAHATTDHSGLQAVMICMRRNCVR
jgi:hypothetical protein